VQVSSGQLDVGVEVNPGKHVARRVAESHRSILGWLGDLKDAYGGLEPPRDVRSSVSAAVADHHDVEGSTSIEEGGKTARDSAFFVVGRDHNARHEPRALGSRRFSVRRISTG